MRSCTDMAGTETVYYECDIIGAADWGGPAERPGVWLAIHAPKGSSLDVLLSQPSTTSIFSCLGEDILQKQLEGAPVSFVSLQGP